MADDFTPRWTRMEYHLGVYQTTDSPRQERAEAECKARAQEGWQIHTADFSSHPHHQILWYRPAALGARTRTSTDTGPPRDDGHAQP